MLVPKTVEIEGNEFWRSKNFTPPESIWLLLCNTFNGTILLYHYHTRLRGCPWRHWKSSLIYLLILCYSSFNISKTILVKCDSIFSENRQQPFFLSHCVGFEGTRVVWWASEWRGNKIMWQLLFRKTTHEKRWQQRFLDLFASNWSLK